jgi:hypothetical protein
MQRVVDWDSARRELAFLQTAAVSGDESEVRHERETERQPTTAVFLYLEHRACQ